LSDAAGTVAADVDVAAGTVEAVVVDLSGDLDAVAEGGEAVDDLYRYLAAVGEAAQAVVVDCSTVFPAY